MTNKYKPRYTTELCTDTDNWVVMGNSLLKGKSALSAKQAKLLRIAIMQVKIDDNGIRAYHVKARKLAELINSDTTHISRDLKNTCYELAEKTVKIDTHNPKKPWKVIPWIGYIEYTDDAEVIIQLNSWLAPYLIGLKKSGQYTQYILDRILSMRSIYSIRIYELLKMKLPNTEIPAGGIKIRVSNDEIRKATETENKIKQNIHFKEKILDVAVKEISEKGDFNVTYIQLKLHGRSFDTVEFECKALWDNGKELPIKVQCKSKFLKMNELRKKQGKEPLGMYDDVVQGKNFSNLEDFDLFLIEYISELDGSSKGKTKEPEVQPQLEGQFEIDDYPEFLQKK